MANRKSIPQKIATVRAYIEKHKAILADYNRRWDLIKAELPADYVKPKGLSDWELWEYQVRRVEGKIRRYENKLQALSEVHLYGMDIEAAGLDKTFIHTQVIHYEQD